MAFSVYCSMTHMHVVEGKAKGGKVHVRDFFSCPLAEGTIINGMITDEEALVHVIRDAAQKKLLPKKRLFLVVDSSNIVARTLTAPILNKKSLYSFIERELSLYHEEGAKMLYDYAVLEAERKEGGGVVLGVAVERAFLEAYRRVFSNAGYALSCIDVGLNAKIKLNRAIPALRDDMHVLSAVDGNNLTLALFDGRNYILANRYRLLHTFGSMGWLEEFSDNISSLVQFNKGQKNKDIESVYIDGLSGEAMAALEKDLVRAGVRIRAIEQENMLVLIDKAAEKKETFSLGRYQFNIGNLVRN